MIRQPSEGHFVSVATNVLCFILNCQESQDYQNWWTAGLHVKYSTYQAFMLKISDNHRLFSNNLEWENETNIPINIIDATVKYLR